MEAEAKRSVIYLTFIPGSVWPFFCVQVDHSGGFVLNSGKENFATMT